VKIKKGILILLAATSCFVQTTKAIGQATGKPVTHQQLMWYGIFSSLYINELWYVQAELQERHFIHPEAQHQGLLRIHLHRSLGKSGWETSAGLAFFLHNPNDPEALSPLTTPEIRPHVEFACKRRSPGITLDHRYRMELRYYHNTNDQQSILEDGYHFENFRFRYRLQATIPIWKSASTTLLNLKLSDEIHLNAGEKIVKNTFDQNRIYLGLNLQATEHLAIETGYMHYLQQRSNGAYFERDILRLIVFHKLYLKK
jgi:hypothetical protein